MKPGRVFILESPNPLDLLEDRAERLALEQVCKLGGYKATTFLIRDKAEFVRTCNYVGSIRGQDSDETPLFLHLSVHGDALGIGVGEATITWKDLAAIVQRMYRNLRFYQGPVILILSACGANKQELTSELTTARAKTKDAYIPPEFIFVFAHEDVDWRDAVVTWTIFYREITKSDFSHKRTIQQLLSKIHRSGFGHLKYFRWDATLNKYRRFLPK